MHAWMPTRVQSLRTDVFGVSLLNSTGLLHSLSSGSCPSTEAIHPLVWSASETWGSIQALSPPPNGPTSTAPCWQPSEGQEASCGPWWPFLRRPRQVEMPLIGPPSLLWLPVNLTHNRGRPGAAPSIHYINLNAQSQEGFSVWTFLCRINLLFLAKGDVLSKDFHSFSTKHI